MACQHFFVCGTRKNIIYLYLLICSQTPFEDIQMQDHLVRTATFKDSYFYRVVRLWNKLISVTNNCADIAGLNSQHFDELDSYNLECICSSTSVCRCFICVSHPHCSSLHLFFLTLFTVNTFYQFGYSRGQAGKGLCSISAIKPQILQI